jgi:hypothetical protein
MTNNWRNKPVIFTIAILNTWMEVREEFYVHHSSHTPRKIAYIICDIIYGQA